MCLHSCPTSLPLIQGVFEGAPESDENAAAIYCHNGSCDSGVFSNTPVAQGMIVAQLQCGVVEVEYFSDAASSQSQTVDVIGSTDPGCLTTYSAGDVVSLQITASSGADIYHRTHTVVVVQDDVCGMICTSLDLDLDH
jgi:hypothetical protein